MSGQERLATLPDLCRTCSLRLMSAKRSGVFATEPVPYCQRSGRRNPTAKLCADHAPPLTRATKARIAEQVREMYAEEADA